MEEFFQKFPYIKIISGNINTGKSTKLYQKTINSNKFVGFITLPVIFPYNKKGYFLNGINIPYKGIISSPYPVLIQPPLFYWKKRWFSDKLFFEITNYLINNHLSLSSKTLIIDEIGPLEKEGKGWYNLLKFVAINRISTEIVIRESFLTEFKELIKYLNS